MVLKVTDEYAAWFTELIKDDLGSATLVAQAVAALREDGPSLHRPLVDRLKGTEMSDVPRREPGDWEKLERELHAAGVSAAEIEAGARKMLALARGTQLADARKEMGVTQREIAAELGVSIARISQIEHGEVTSLDVIARYVEALGGRLDLVADFGDRTLRLPVTDAGSAA